MRVVVFLEVIEISYLLHKNRQDHHRHEDYPIVMVCHGIGHAPHEMGIPCSQALYSSLNQTGSPVRLSFAHYF
jgi:hypothetical protein